jgi:uncharacterized protein YdaU (DUF1376 family)
MDTATKGNIPVTGSKKVAKHSTAAIHPIADMDRVIDQFFSRNMPSLWHSNRLSSLDDMFVL